MSYGYDDALRVRIAAHLLGFDRAEAPGLRRAAVAVLLAPHPGTGECAYVFSQRAWTLRRNAGQYALPGGRSDDGEALAVTARRELAEELGISVGPESVLGLLDDMPTHSGFAMTPVVLWAGGSVTLTPDPAEVHDAWLVPVRELDHPEAPRRVPAADGGPAVLRMPVRGEWINPPTAAVLYQFREVALHGRAVRVAHEPAPGWTAT